jgi:phage anti-repressor protein
MMIRTEKANQIRDYYVDIEELYLEFNKCLLHNKDEKLKKIIKY